MPRIPRVVIPGIPYHVTQRGNGRRDIFYTAADRQIYLDLLARYAERHQMAIWAYCLMSNHLHLVASPRRPESLARALGRAHAQYARYRNLIDRGCGHVWEARYFSCPLERAHLWRAIAYVERNPVRAGIVDHAEAYPWSSARARLGGVRPDFWTSRRGKPSTAPGGGGRFSRRGSTRRRFSSGFARHP